MILSLSHKHDLASIDLKSADWIVYQVKNNFHIGLIQVKFVIFDLQNDVIVVWFRQICIFLVPRVRFDEFLSDMILKKNDLDDWKPRVSMISFDFFWKKKRLCHEDDQLNYLWITWRNRMKSKCSNSTSSKINQWICKTVMHLSYAWLQLWR